jgi:peptidoglycan/xylan/chitin deacetylase (PgdA/CDA1 family)
VVSSLRTFVKNVVYDRVPNLLRRGPVTSKRVALTFDDGPDEMTPKYLDLLDQLGVPATFFLVGQFADRHPDLVREYLRRGHQVANHGYDHTRFTKLSRRALLDQCLRTEHALNGQITGKPWVRPPHGTLDASSLFTLLTTGYTVAMWTIDSCDYHDKDPASLAQRCSPDNISAGEVLLFHESQQWTLDALPQIVAGLHGAGYECVTMYDLFAS